MQFTQALLKPHARRSSQPGSCSLAPDRQHRWEWAAHGLAKVSAHEASTNATLWRLLQCPEWTTARYSSGRMPLPRHVQSQALLQIAQCDESLEDSVNGIFSTTLHARWTTRCFSSVDSGIFPRCPASNASANRRINSHTKSRTRLRRTFRIFPATAVFSQISRHKQTHVVSFDHANGGTSQRKAEGARFSSQLY